MIGGEFAEVSAGNDLVGGGGDVVSFEEKKIYETVTAFVMSIIIHSSLHIFGIYAGTEIGISI